MRILMAASVVSLALLAGCQGSGEERGDASWTWTTLELWKDTHKIQGAAGGAVAVAAPGLEVAATDATGRVILVTFPGGKPKAEVIYEHGSKLTGVSVLDIDPAVAGPELYVGGYREKEQGGAVVQITRKGGKTATRTIWEGSGFVHAFAALPPEDPTAPPELVIPTYAGEVHLAAPTSGDGPWTSRRIHVEPEVDDPELLEIKQAAAGTIGDLERRVFICAKSGRGVLIDPDGAAEAEVIHQMDRGMARLALDRDTTLVVVGDDGSVLRLSRSDGDWTSEKLFNESDKLRGVVVGNFPVKGGRAGVAVFGYPGVCRAILKKDSAWTHVDLFADSDKGHWLAAGDVVEGNDADELACAGYSGRLVLLVREKADD